MKWLDRLFGGPKDMAALPAGTKAPDFSLPAVFSDKDGGKFSLQAALKQGPVLAAFFKVSCPVCQYTLPYLERMHKAHGDKKITIVGISQDNQRDTAAFLKEYGVSFRTLLDDPNGYAVSNAYGLTNVPTVFEVTSDGQIAASIVGWAKAEIEEIYARYLDHDAGAMPLFRSGEQGADFRPG